MWLCLHFALEMEKVDGQQNQQRIEIILGGLLGTYGVYMGGTMSYSYLLPINRNKKICYWLYNLRSQ
jgi:hypothetical protein